MTITKEAQIKTLTEALDKIGARLEAKEAKALENAKRMGWVA